ncbi:MULTISPECIES: hypothetical protein [unclassified Tatumella]|uniref:hypothetical protein n=1 Tax=unclassified Tatumella TaxID=2649542 RepID=UPI001BAF9613|nr:MULTISPECIES: hypothetical protein [unclassified Tatumella]MBS0878872.1 hypothetical protein [Tatumella sp. JGM82]MBS0892397.1 hypothetical protein [Tatumella sp. JGM94]
MNPKLMKYFLINEVTNNLNPILKIVRMNNDITSDQKIKCKKCNKEIFHPLSVLPLIHCRCEYEKWDFENQSLYIQKIYKDEHQQDLVAIKIGITKQDGNIRKNFTDSFSIYHHKLYYEVRMNYELAAHIETRIKKELPGGFISRDEMKDGFTETFSPQYLEDFHRIINEEIQKTTDPYMRVM